MNKLIELLRPQSVKDVVFHFLIALTLGAILLIWFFTVRLPGITRQGELVEVPDLQGKKLSELANYLDEMDLGYFVQDSAYNPDLPPLSVFLQHPNPGSKVKPGRKIFISINSSKPPEVEMPNLFGRSVINAEDELNSYGLSIGNIDYVPDIQQNAVLKQLYQGKEIKPGAKIKKGESIDLVVGSGKTEREIPVPDVLGKENEEGQFILEGANIRIGAVTYEPQSKEPTGTIIRIKPEVGQNILVGDAVDIWVAGEEPKVTDEENGIE